MDVDRSPRSRQSLSFLILGQRIRVSCADRALRRILAANFGAMAVTDVAFVPDLEYAIESSHQPPLLSLIRPGQAPLYAADPGDLLFLLEKDVTVSLQKRRPDLFFLHSAAIDWAGKACLLAADSGSGKSTTTWALLHYEFGYLSDELTPIDLGSLRAFPYPHALCLKQPPPHGYALPEDALHLGRTIHVPVQSLPSATTTEPRPLGVVFLLSYRPDLSAPRVHAIAPAEAGARLYVTALNALAHPNHGLDAVVRIAEHVPCFAVLSADLAATSALIRSTVEQAFAGVSRRGKSSPVNGCSDRVSEPPVV